MPALHTYLHVHVHVHVLYVYVCVLQETCWSAMSGNFSAVREQTSAD